MKRWAASLEARLFEPFNPPRELRAHAAHAPPANGICIRWLGTAGFVIECGSGRLLIDPYLTRAPLVELACKRLTPNESALREWLPSNVRAVVCGHSHFDHLLDAPLAAKLEHTYLVGSRTTTLFGKASGLEREQLVEVSARGERRIFGEFDVEFVASLHARILLGNVPFQGVLTHAPRLPARIWNYRMGGAFGILVNAGGVRVYHNGSADLIDAELAGKRADVVLVGLAGRQVTPRYLERLLDSLRPALVIPAHHDAMFTPLSAGVRLLPGIDFLGFVAEVARILPSAKVVAPFYGEPVWFAGAANATDLVEEDALVAGR